MPTTIRVKEETYKMLIKKRGSLELKDGKRRSLDDVILELSKNE